MRFSWCTAALVGAGLLLPGCGSGEQAGPAVGASAPAAGTVVAGTVTAAATGDDLPLPVASQPPPIPKIPSPALPVVLRGVLQPGVESGCLLLATPAGVYVLLGDVRLDGRPAGAGTAVEVTGTPSPDRATTCQQGTPLVVQAVRAR